MRQTGSMPFGNAFLVQTPAMDNLSNRLMQEQKQRELQQRQDSKMLDEEFSKNLSGMWDADIPELTQKYGEYKQAWKDLYKKKDGGTPQEQLDVLKKKADMYSTLGRSKEHRGWWEGKVKTVQGDKKGLFADDAAQRLSSLRTIPSSQVNRDEVESKLPYPYSVPDFDKINKEAIGTPTEKRGTTVASTIDPLKDETPVWKVGNTPNQMYEHILNSVVSKNLGRNFTGLVLHAMSDQEKEDITNKYVAKIKDPKFIAAYGETQPFNPMALSTDLGQAVALQTMKNVVDMPIPEPKIERVDNKDRVTKANQSFQLQKQAIADANTMKHIRAGSGSSGTGLLNYDVLKTYEGKKTNIKTVMGGGKEDFDVVLKKDVDVKDQELIGVSPYNNGGVSYYKVRPDGDWEGKDGQVVSWAKVAQANLDKTSANEAKRGRTTLTADKTKSTSNEIHVSDVPTGTKLEQKNGKYYYKGQEVKM